MTSESLQAAPDTREPEWLTLVRSKVQDLRYGVVQVVVHDGRVTQIERTERTRLESIREDPRSR
jgi:hypothetical protein